MVTALRGPTAILTRVKPNALLDQVSQQGRRSAYAATVLLPTYLVQFNASAVASLSHAYMLIGYRGPYRHQRTPFRQSFCNKVAEHYLNSVFASASYFLHFNGQSCIRLRGLCGLLSSTNTCGYSISFSEPASTWTLLACILHPQTIELALSGYGPKIRKVQPRTHRKQRGSKWPKQIEPSISGLKGDQPKTLAYLGQTHMLTPCSPSDTATIGQGRWLMESRSFGRHGGITTSY